MLISPEQAPVTDSKSADLGKIRKGRNTMKSSACLDSVRITISIDEREKSSEIISILTSEDYPYHRCKIKKKRKENEKKEKPSFPIQYMPKISWRLSSLFSLTASQPKHTALGY
ncbi:hypothetical protein M9H77_08320 [Catharanthus roseus]|uniref:Uncharacterized protein n=1 Tax=Catharanthus roseus TaxID=4058 RepID=A0ACC0BXL8_CATRO|nr:hypothetical protein M9H77_08320 [Catharanthus roseus]